ncbi:unnamed protein product, partial [Rotaria socialis]
SGVKASKWPIRGKPFSSNNVDSGLPVAVCKFELDKPNRALLLLERTSRQPNADVGRGGAVSGGRRFCAVSNLDKQYIKEY